MVVRFSDKREWKLEQNQEERIKSTVGCVNYTTDTTTKMNDSKTQAEAVSDSSIDSSRERGKYFLLVSIYIYIIFTKIDCGENGKYPILKVC